MQHTLPATAINGEIDKLVSPLDRGFAYGDGVFETCRMINAQIPLWSMHSERLIASCEKLFIPVTIALIKDYLAKLIAQINVQDLTEAVVKIIITRGQGGRGYRLPEVVDPTICITIFPATAYPDSYCKGVTVRICELRLSCNTRLAGLKHLNRLEYVLARAEWCDESFVDGLLFDTNSNLIEATVSNIFIVKNGVLFTPDLTEAGVAGVMRRLIIENLGPTVNLTTKIQKLSREDLFDADEIFLCNSVFGIWPVVTVSDHQSHVFSPGQHTIALQNALNRYLSVHQT